GFSCPRALQSHAAPPPPPSPPSMGTGGRGCEGVADVPQQKQLPPRLLLSLSPCRTLCWERGGSLEVQGEAGGDLQHQPPPAPPLGMGGITLSRGPGADPRCAAVEPSCAATACATRSCSPGGLPPHAPTAAVPPLLPPHAPVSAASTLAAGLLQLYLPLLHWLSLLLSAAALFCLVYPCRLCVALGSSCMQYWQNDVSIAALRHSSAQLHRPEPRLVSDILEPNRMPAPVTSPNHPSQYQCNGPGKPRQALPTLVVYEEARGFIMEGELPGPGMIFDVRKGRWEQPAANEREATMGHLWQATAHPEVTARQRRAAIGKAMDVNVMMWPIETIRMHLKVEVERGIVASERIREYEITEWHKKLLEEMGERYEDRIVEGYAYMAMEEGEVEEGGDSSAKAGEGEAKKGQRTPEESWPLGEGLGKVEAAAMQQVLQQH
ncbi:unnamed protein product, partial [Closterium sp. NIES-54]